MNLFKSLRKLLLPLALVCAMAVPGVAQDPVPTYSTTFHNSVDVATTQAVISVPTYHKDGIGLPFTLNAVFQNAQYGRVGGPNWPWTEYLNGEKINTAADTLLMQPAGMGTIAFQTNLASCGTQMATRYYNIHFISASGRRHDFPGAAVWSPSGYAGCPTTATVTSADGSGLTWTADTSTHFNGGRIIFPNGNIYDQNGLSGTSLTDVNGNYIQFIKDDSTHSHYVDTLGMTVLSIDTSSTTQYKYTYTGSDGLSKTVYATFTTRTRGASTFCGGSGAQIGSWANERVLSSIVYPDNSSYTFVFETNTDRLTSITAPTGEVVSFSYPDSDGYICDPTYNTTYPRITVTKPEGVWNYTTADQSGPRVATETDPAGNVINYTFVSVTTFGTFLEVQRLEHQGASTLLETINTCYNAATSPCTGTAISFPITQVDV
jgi:hypothetical protein